MLLLYKLYLEPVSLENWFIDIGRQKLKIKKRAAKTIFFAAVFLILDLLTTFIGRASLLRKTAGESSSFDINRLGIYFPV